MDVIDLYKPNVSLGETFTIDNKLSKPEKAFEVYKKLKLAVLYQDALFLVIGKLLKHIKEERLYKQLDFKSFEQFLANDDFAFSREKAYMCIRVYEYYFEKLQISEKDIYDIGITKLSYMLPIIRDKPEHEAIKRINELRNVTTTDLVKTVKHEYNSVKAGKPSVSWSNEHKKWVVRFYEDRTFLMNMGNFTDEQ